MGFKSKGGQDYPSQWEADYYDNIGAMGDDWKAKNPGASNEDWQEAMQNMAPAAKAKTNEGLTPQEIAANEEQYSKDHPKDYMDDGVHVTSSKEYISPGSADVGGYKEGAKDIHDFFRSGEKENDAAQAGNSAAMGLSLDRMRENRAPIAENAALVGREAASRQQQLNATGLMGQAAAGNAPSAANAQTSMAMNDSMAGQAGAAGAARGLGALNGVQAGAAGVGMQATSAMMGGGMARSKEVNDSMGAYGGLSGDVRSGDLGRVGQTNQNALAGQSLNDDWKVNNAGLAAKQAQLGNSMGQVDDSYFGASQEPAKRQLGYDQEMAAIGAGQSLDSAAAKRAKVLADQDRDRALATGAITTGLTLVGGPVAGTLGGGISNSVIKKAQG